MSFGTKVASYAGQPISSIALGSNATVVIPGTAATVAAAITGLTATRSGGDVVLNWPAVTQATDGSALSALAYRVYARANDPAFTPTPADLVAEVAGTTFTHIGGSNPALNYTYVVTAIGNNCWKLESALSNRVAAPVNHAPVANAQSLTTPQNTALTILLTGSDVDGNALTYRVATNPAHGTLSGTAPSLTYAPTAGYTGPDSFTFVANDGVVDSTPATVSINVAPISPVNRAPVANAQGVTTAEDTAAAVTLTASDADNNALTYRVMSNPSHGTLSGTAPSLTYTPAANYNGPDSFTFVANDGIVDSAPATVSITVTPVNDAPVANAQVATTSQGVAVAITLAGSDVDGNPLTYRVATNPGHGTLGGTAPSLTYTPAAGYTGPDSFTFVANDGQVDSAPAMVSITVTSAPPAAPTNLVATLQNGSQVQLTWRDNATNETGFVVERATNGGAFVQITAPGPRNNRGNVTYSDTTVAAGNTYAYRVKAVRGAVSSAFSNTASVTVPNVPAAPSGLTATTARVSVLFDSVSLKWVDNANNETSFTVQRSKNASFTSNLVTVNNVAANSVTYTQTGVPRRTTYYYRVRATNGAGPSAWSNVVSVTTP